MRALWFFPILLIKLFYLCQNVVANEVLGCGGFLKSHADIDFSKVEIKLITKQGSLKDKTDCSPSNGYYFLPIYDKGEYVLKISPPPGWSFEPEQVELKFDGVNDICSKGKDVNFAFKGFGITGKVVFAGYGSTGSRGVNVELKSADGKDVRKTTTDINGIFSFTPIIPGKYVIRASHAKWHFSKDEHVVLVESGNTELAENSLVVSGFDVTGRFDFIGQMSAGISVAIFRKKGQTLPLKCHRGAPITLTVDNSNYESSSACYTQVDKSGYYTFQGVAPGNYLLQPVFDNANLNLHVSPAFLEFEVLKDSVDMKSDFRITGFSISGRVLTSAVEGTPIAGAVVKVNGEAFTQTDADGSYTLDNIKGGTYTILVEAPQMVFNEQKLKLQITTAALPDIVPQAYEVCGQVVSKKSYVVGITKHASTFHTTVSSKAESGEWCTYLPSGRFIVEVITTDADKASGIQFYPLQQNIEVKSQPLHAITFSQLRATLKGELHCLPDAPQSCIAAEVTLHSLDANGQATGRKQTTNAKNGKYAFKEILPGPYEITIPSAKLCFESTRVLINVAAASETAPPFLQRGYEVTMISSHRVIMKYAFVPPSDAQNTAAPMETAKLLSGMNTLCVTKYGTYKIKLEGCHFYDETLPKTFTTSDASPVMVNAVAHKIGVRVLSPDADVASLKLLIESNTMGKQTITPTAESHKVDGKYAYRYETHLKPKEVIHITPQSDVLLFTPQMKEIIGTNDCVETAFNFDAARGLILRGKVVPPIKDVKITLTFTDNDNAVPLDSLSALTSVTGEFKFGPIDEKLSYKLTAAKDSYVFSEYNPQTASFGAHKLCEIIVVVKDEMGKGLSGVLISLSGGESYRKNLVTGETGAMNFHSLSPSQYFLRPMMKEYKFEPNSKMIDIKDGETVEIELIGKRVAYSVFGTISSLNGEPFAQVNIEATSDDSCMHHQEEATTENNGQYRLRGLQPGCTYTIRLKDAGTPNANVARAIPSTRTVQIEHADVRDVNLIAISPITFVDVTARVTASLNEHYKTLRIVMYRKGAADSPLYSQRVETPLNMKSRFNPGIMVFFPRIPLDGKTYVVELKSTLSDRTYSYVLPTQSFVADTSSVYVELDFKPEVRTAESDLNQNSISALVLVALVAIAFFKQDIAMDFLNFVWSKANSIAQEIAQKQKNNNKKDTNRKPEPINQREIEQMAEQINAIKKKKTKKIT